MLYSTILLFAMSIVLCQAKFPPSGTLVFDKKTNYQMVWSTKDNIATVTLSQNQDGWMGIGFSTNATMIGAKMFIVAEYTDNGACTVKLYSLGPTGYVAPVVDKDQSPIKAVSGSTGSNKSTAKFTIDNTKVPNTANVLWAGSYPQTPSPTMNYHVLQKGVTTF